MKKILNFLRENILWVIFVAIFTTLFLIKHLVPDIESISWLNKIITFPFVFVAGAVIIFGGFEVFKYIVGFFECENEYQAIPIVLIIVCSLVIALPML